MIVWGRDCELWLNYTIKFGEINGFKMMLQNETFSSFEYLAIQGNNIRSYAVRKESGGVWAGRACPNTPIPHIKWVSPKYICEYWQRLVDSKK